MSAVASSAPPRARARRNLTVLMAAQVLLGSQLPVAFILGGLAGQTLAPNRCLATLPITLIIVGSMLSAPMLGDLMQRRGRRPGFMLGAAGGGLGAALCAFALMQGSFGLFLAGSLLIGLYQSAQGFYRFAATDGVDGAFRARAISYVLGAGLASAVVGPQLVRLTADALAPIPFAGAYVAAAALNLVGVWVFVFLDSPAPPPPAPDGPRARSRLELIRTPRIAVAMICAMVSYALMNLVMTSTPLAVVGCGFSTGQAANVVSGHVLAMFAPSFFTGHLIARFGVEKIIATGLVDPRRRRRRRALGRRAHQFRGGADPARARLELRLHRRDHHARRRPCSGRARARAGHERLRRVRPRRHRLAHLRRADELLGRRCGHRLDRGQPRDGAVPRHRRRRTDLAGAAGAADRSGALTRRRYASASSSGGPKRARIRASIWSRACR